MYTVDNLLHQDFHPNNTSGFRFSYGAQSDREMGFLKRVLPLDKRSKVSIVSSKSEENDSEDELLKEKENAKLKMMEEREDEDEQDSNDNRNLSETFVAVIAQSILSVPTKRMTLSSIYSYIASHYPHFDKEKGPGWRNSVRHNLSSNDCFVKASRAENGKGHYWMIHPKDLPEFSKGNFRRPRKPRRPRCSQGISCFSERSFFPSPIGGSYFMSPYAAKHSEYDYAPASAAFPLIASTPDVFTRAYGIPSRYDAFPRDESLAISGYHNLSPSSSPTYLGFPWPDTSIFRNYPALSHGYYPYMFMPPGIGDVSLLQKDSLKPKDD
ncbi:forkhead box protein I1 [Exaiptasia diaphana]|uniref:Fork-head domain-containing protein n=1 Tax=Exaiptasia diaphana TaxID=2652724 RepID=A0A913XE45_EXADI|nr:forkhead box protein I1 [Exaiptasia diaphana]KXJ12724.1 Forkhead box protein I1 [Exaiptasia diaphana]